MRNILLEIEYDGSVYAGWQIQKNAMAVQQVIEDKLRPLLKEKVKLTAAGRTDSGVHAIGQAANFKTHSNLNCDNILKALNSLLPKNICIKKAGEVSLNFNARFSAKSKIYRYVIYNSKIRSVFFDKYAWRVSYKLNIPLMKLELKEIIGRHNFKSFSAAEKIERQPERKILTASLKKKDGLLFIDIEGESFLYNMVRNIVGTLIEIGRGKLLSGSMKKILAAKDRKAAGPCAPPYGLYLLKVNF
ncbi:MAG: tRNA pseudouridine(38-40) synthase TruA [Candidatus Omnitrophota bacterium]